MRNLLAQAALTILLAWILSYIRVPATNRQEAERTNIILRTNASMVYDQFILFGDSLFQHSSSQERGFNLAPALQAEYVRRLDVVNRGFSGYNTDQALAVLPKFLPRPEQARIRFFAILLGANDACLEGAEGSQHVPLDRYRANLKAIIEHPDLQVHKPRIILVTPPPINEYVTEEGDRMKGYGKRRTAAHTKLYADAAKDVGKQTGVVVLDLYSLFMAQANWDGKDPLVGSKDLPASVQLRLMLHDGLHFTSVAYTHLFQEIMRTIERVWPDQAPEKLAYVLPAWNNPSAWPGIGQ